MNRVMQNGNKTAWDYIWGGVGTAFNWLNKNEAAADFISGAAVQMLANQAMSDKRKAEELKERREDERRKINYASIENYTGNLVGGNGLLTNGLLANPNRGG